MTRYECPPELMRAAHLLPRRAVVWSEFFGLKMGDISTARNGMMVCIPIERAFDTKRVSTLPLLTYNLLLLILLGLFYLG